MRMKLPVIVSVAYFLIFAVFGPAQDLGPEFHKIKEGIYIRSASPTDPRPNADVLNSNCGIILTREGVVLIDSGENPTDSQAVMKAVRKLTPLPVRFLIDTETHSDHTTGHYVFSPPAVIIAHEGAAESMKNDFDPERMKKYMKESPENAAAAQGYRMIFPQVEYPGHLTLHLGERTFELIYLKNVHSEADTAVWLPNERILFSASSMLPNAWNRIRPFVTIPDLLNTSKLMRTLNPEIVIPGHGPASTPKLFDDSDRFYNVLVERVRAMVREGKTFEQIQKEFRLPEYDYLLHKERIPENIEGAYRAVMAGFIPHAQ